MVTGLVPVTLEQRNTLGKNTNNPRWYTHKSQLTKFMPSPETYKSEIGSHPTMCQVHTGAYVSLLAPGKTDYTACHPRKTTTYILHVVSITRHAHNRRKSVGNTKQRTTKRKERKWVHGAKKKKRKINFGGLLSRLPIERDVTCHVVFRRSTAVVLRTTSDTRTETRTIGKTRDRQLAVVVTCLCVGGPSPASCWLLRVMRVRLNLPTNITRAAL